MANSVVKVSDIKDDALDDNLFLLVGEDGTVAPDQETVENYLKQRSGPTNIQIMKINHSEKQAIDISVDSVTYMPDVVSEEVVSETVDMEEVERNLHNFRLDHDYTPFTSPKGSPSPPMEEEEDELAKTLSILDGPNPAALIPISPTKPPPLVMTNHQKVNKAPKVKLIQSITLTPSKHIQQMVKSNNVVKTSEGFKDQGDIDESVYEQKVDPETSQMESEPLDDSDGALSQKDLAKGRAKVIKTYKPAQKSTPKPRKEKPKPKPKLEESEDDDSDYTDGDFDMEMEDDENDSDFEIKDVKTPKRTSRRTKSESKTTPQRRKLKNKEKETNKKLEKEDEEKTSKERHRDKSPDKIKVQDKGERSEEKDKHLEKKMSSEEEKHTDKDKTSQSEQPGDAKSDKKTPHKKKKEIPKPILDDFNLFATPDIIKRVGGKEPTTPVTPTSVATPTSKTPAKITQESRGKSADQPIGSPIKNNRVSLDAKIDNHKEREKEKAKEKDKEKEKDKVKNKEKERLAERDSHVDKEKKDKEGRLSTSDKSKRLSVDEKVRHKDVKSESRSERHSTDRKNSSKIAAENILNTDEIPSAEDIRSIIMGDEKSFTASSASVETESSSQNMEVMNLDASGLDLDPTILDNLNNDELSEDILYQVAQSLVSNPELQNAIDKGINEGVLDPNAVHNSSSGSLQSFDEDSSGDVIQKGTQIVRPDGRIVVIPPIERPTTRSRNKKKEEVKPVFKPVHKPLDDEHVSGNELDSSNDEEEESEDDPNKLWCICNQPHNNRFMICCDTCEEWYHGKCVNITKTMGQQMEAEGREWICLFCKDPSLKRPQAAARRIRKASRNSRTSTESTGSTSKKSVTSSGSSASSVKCVVCNNPARKNSIYCSESCILAHAQGIERVVVFERSTGKMLTGNKAPSAANLDQWLKEHRGYEVLKSGGRVVTAKPGSQLMQSKLKLVKNTEDHGVSLAVQKKGVSLGVLKHTPKHTQAIQQHQQQAADGQNKTPVKLNYTNIKVTPKATQALKESRAKLSQTTPQSGNKTPAASPSTTKSPKLVQSTLTKASPQATPVKPKDKPAIVKSPRTPKPKQPEAQQTATPKQQEDIRENVEKTLFEQLTNRLKGCEDLKLTEEEVKNISKEIESQLFKCFGDTGQKYRNKYRSLIFNIKDAKNQTLWRRICEKSINPYELVRLSPDDLASQELAMWREREAKHQLDMIKKSELELLNCNRQYVLKTHKGEQIVEDDRVDKVDNTEVIKSLTEGSTLETVETKSEKDKKSSSKHSHKDKDRDRTKDKKSSHRSRRSSSRDRSRKRSRSRSRSRDYRKDHKKHRSKDRSRDRNKEKSRDKDRHKKSHKSSKHRDRATEELEKLDKKSKEILENLRESKILPPVLPPEQRLWKHVTLADDEPAPESDSDNEPTSTVTIPTPPRSQDDDYQSSIDQKSEKDKSISEMERSTSPPPRTKPTELWTGIINMPDVAQISITAHEVSGDCTGLGRELAASLDIVGRISPDTVWDYIGKMKCSNSKAISLIRLSANNVEEKMPYLALYSYLSSRDRLGVVKSLNKAVKDFYIYPLAPTKPIPQVLLPLNGPGFEEQRPALLLGIIVRDKRKRPLFEMPPTPSIIANLSKKPKLEVPAVVAAAVAASHSTPSRSYTPPPPAAAPPLPAPVPAVPAPVPPVVPAAPTPPKDPRLKLPLPPLEPPPPDDGDEPYSPGDSSPDLPDALVTPPPSLARKSVPEPVNVPPTTPLSVVPSVLPGNQQELQRHLDELNRKIEASKSEISNMTQNIVSVQREIETSALANIALPSNLQQILDSIKTIGENTTDSDTSTPKESSSTDLTIPLMIPKNFTPRVSAPPPQPVPPLKDLPSDTIPLNLPSKPKIKPPSVNSPLLEEKSVTPTPSTTSTSVLGSLSEEDLIKKAAEMLGEDASLPMKKEAKRAKMEVTLPPVPGLED
ncbi:unnamed protein product [Acanthoscelides obtectus]|uniref:Death-inducer obliterator 1 n=1 Tax=Acanthoscelides obtectus TaxID=200917 RepID=A0A9P0PD30_ACAOB|nr:unnamed protein product [Acanthoscelides obtectus]CAK1642640.1 Death-inducer obliterator 1 [Acanthoscelides obtectus]